MEKPVSIRMEKDGYGFGFDEIAKKCKSNQQGIYSIKCLKNNKIYIGQGIDIRRRFIEHSRSLRQGRHNNTIMQNAYNRHGEKSFEFRILEIVPDADLLYEREAHWCNVYNAFDKKKGFNICPIIKNEFDKDEFAQRVMGSKNGNSKLTEIDVRKICKILNKGNIPVSKLADTYGMTERSVRDIKIGRTWRQVSVNYLSEEIKNSWKIAS